MGLIREPQNIDFTVIDKPWTDEERKELSVFIKFRKGQRKKRRTLSHKIKDKTLSPSQNKV